MPLFDRSEDSKIHCRKKAETCDAEDVQLKCSIQCWMSIAFMEIDDFSTEKVDEMNIIDNDSDIDSDIDVED